MAKLNTPIDVSKIDPHHEGVIKKSSSTRGDSENASSMQEKVDKMIKERELENEKKVDPRELKVIKIDLSKRSGQEGSLLTQLAPFNYRADGKSFRVGGPLHAFKDINEDVGEATFNLRRATAADKKMIAELESQNKDL